MGIVKKIEDKVEGLVDRLEGKPQAPAAVTPVVPAPAVASTVGGAPAIAAIPHRTLLIHGYSASGVEFEAWRDALAAKGVPTATIEIGNYISLNNEVTIKDLGEAFDRALRLTQWSDGSKDDAWTFDAVVHSTGMLVVRQWLTSDPFARTDARSRVKRLKHLVGLAPASFGSPQGKQGRSWLGALVKGNRDLGPDFMNAGDQVLDGLELGSKYTWDLAMKDMLADKPIYDEDDVTPYVAVFIGNVPYTGLARLASAPGTDGTVRWAGCALDSRLVQLDFQRQPKLTNAQGQPVRVKISDWSGRLTCPMLAVDERNHGSILSDPVDDVVERVSTFLLTVNSKDSYDSWFKTAAAASDGPRKTMDAASEDGDYGGAGWQQFVFHVKDDHGDGVDDYNVQLYVGDDLAQSDDKEFAPQPLIADAYSTDASYRCFYVRLDDAMLNVGKPGYPKKVWMELIASSGTAYLEFEAYLNQGTTVPAATGVAPPKTVEDPATAVPDTVKLDLTNLGQEATLFYPYTTTLVEIVLERAPTPLGVVSTIFQFLKV